MFLVIDVGNSNIDAGVFSAEKGKYELIASFRLSTPSKITTDEMAIAFKNMLHYNQVDSRRLTRAIFSSVVPTLNHNITKMMGNYFQLPNIIQVTNSLFNDMEIFYDKVTIGMDRLVNVKAAGVLYGTPAIVIDFGTATTIDVISSKEEYLGGLIIPGVAISLDSLVRNTSQLPKVELDYPKRIIAKNTRESMQNGVYYLNSLGVDAIIAKIKEEHFVGEKCHVIATGGLSNYIARNSQQNMTIEPGLLLIGLKILLDKIEYEK